MLAVSKLGISACFVYILKYFIMSVHISLRDDLYESAILYI